MSLFVNYRSTKNLARLISNNTIFSELDFDIVVGIPRSGMLPASMIALYWNRPLADLDGFVAGNVMGHGRTRRPLEFRSDAESYRKPLVVDDSVFTGRSIAAARAALAGMDGQPTYLAIYTDKRSRRLVDHALETVPVPRIFEWNMWHSWLCARACVDLDGIICPDPTPEQNDDGPRYVEFMRSAPALVVPTEPLAHIVTSRLEKYRPQTEAWLKEKSIPYKNLHMLDLPSAAERRRRMPHAEFKACVYARVDVELFVESEPWQAIEIARRSGKPVLNFQDQTICYPDRISVNLATEAAKRLSISSYRFAKRNVRRIIPNPIMNRIRPIMKRNGCGV